MNYLLLANIVWELLSPKFDYKFHNFIKNSPFSTNTKIFNTPFFNKIRWIRCMLNNFQNSQREFEKFQMISTIWQCFWKCLGIFPAIVCFYPRSISHIQKSLLISLIFCSCFTKNNRKYYCHEFENLKYFCTRINGFLYAII